MLLVGSETVYRLIARSVAPLALIKGVLPGQTVQMIVQAANGNTLSVASRPILFTVPVVQAVSTTRTAAAAAVETPVPAPAASVLEPFVAVGTNGNGHRAAATSDRLPALS